MTVIASRFGVAISCNQKGLPRFARNDGVSTVLVTLNLFQGLLQSNEMLKQVQQDGLYKELNS